MGLWKSLLLRDAVGFGHTRLFDASLINHFITTHRRITSHAEDYSRFTESAEWNESKSSLEESDAWGKEKKLYWTVNVRLCRVASISCYMCYDCRWWAVSTYVWCQAKWLWSGSSTKHRAGGSIPISPSCIPKCPGAKNPEPQIAPEGCASSVWVMCDRESAAHKCTAGMEKLYYNKLLVVIKNRKVLYKSRAFTRYKIYITVTKTIHSKDLMGPKDRKILTLLLYNRSIDLHQSELRWSWKKSMNHHNLLFSH